MKQFYEHLLLALRSSALRDGEWCLLETTPAWENNPTSNDFIAFAWSGARDERLLVTVNFAAHQGQCYVPLPFKEFAGNSLRFNDLMSPARYVRTGNDVVSRGLYLDLPEWGYHVFDMKVA